MGIKLDDDATTSWAYHTWLSVLTARSRSPIFTVDRAKIMFA